MKTERSKTKSKRSKQTSTYLSIRMQDSYICQMKEYVTDDDPKNPFLLMIRFKNATLGDAFTGKPIYTGQVVINIASEKISPIFLQMINKILGKFTGALNLEVLGTWQIQGEGVVAADDILQADIEPIPSSRLSKRPSKKQK